MTVRHATSADYEAIARILTLQRPDFPRTVAMLKRADETRPDYCKHQWYLAETSDEITGIGYYTQHPDLYHPARYHVDVYVLPEYRQHGIGRNIYQMMLADIEANNGTELYGVVPEGDTIGLQFAENRGFRANSTRIESQLAVITANIGDLENRLHKLREMGITVKAWSEFDQTPSEMQQFYELATLVDSQVPMDPPVEALTFEEWQTEFVDHPNFLADGTFIAKHDNTFAGLIVQSSFMDNMVYIMLTGTSPTYQRKGIATTLKMQALAYAKSAGYEYASTTNDSNNPGILSLNQKLGFQPKKTVINLKLNLG